MKNFIPIDVVTVGQLNGNTLFVGKMTFLQILSVYKLTERQESSEDPYSAKRSKTTNKDFQRHLNPTKLKEIAEFIESKLFKNKDKDKSSLNFFPTSILIALDHEIDYDSSKLNEQFLNEIYEKEKNLSSCFINADSSKIFIPKNAGISLIVDGQHRFCGMKLLYDSIKDKSKKEEIERFEFPITFLVGFDIYDLGLIFANVNFEQKPVNRSLYYDIFGSIPDMKRNEIKLAHDLTLHLNNNPDSPINGMIKLLGRGEGLFSQAFFVEKILKHLQSKAVWGEIYSDFLIGGDRHKRLPIFMKSYFKAIKDAYPSSWPKRVVRKSGTFYSSHGTDGYKFILCKSTGIGAFLRLIRDLYPLVEDKSEGEMYAELKRILCKVSDEKAEKLFSKEGKFARSGGEGLVSDLYTSLKTEFGLKSK